MNRSGSSRTVLARLLGPFPWLSFLLLCSLMMGSVGVYAQQIQKVEDHGRTGYALVGVHATARCESCHLNGVFKGTPRDCASCHTSGASHARSNVVKPANHLPTQNPCDTCHVPRAFSAARFSHSGVQSGTCATCHNGIYTNGKPSTHLSTQASCDTCHRSSGWRPASGFDHTNVTPGSCATCHNGTTATGKRAQHMPVAQASSCDNCHRTSSWRPTLWNHSQLVVAGQCVVCHSGAYPPADGPVANHIPYKSLLGVVIGSCDSCHKGGYSSWASGLFHSSVSVSGQCATCHTGSYLGAVGKPATATHATVTGNCESCHKSTASWAASGKPDHNLFNAATNCGACHNGAVATGRPSTHMPIGNATCGACHSVAGWKPTQWNHSQLVVSGQCASCHSGAYPPADAKPANHIPYTALVGVTAANCDTCHKGGYSSWASGLFHSSVSVSNQCATCHTGSYLAAVGKPATATHASVTGNCEGCHKSTASWASSGKPDHGMFTVATNCAACHNGSTATGRPSTHIPIGNAGCMSCHNVTGWKPTKWNHSQLVVAGQCATCHSGSYPPADAKPATHIPYTGLAGVTVTSCDTCHKGGTTAWAPARLHGSISVSSQCATCHTGSYPPAVGKPSTATHASVTGNCETCHKSTSSWTSGTRFAHSAANAVGTGTCDTCHNGSTAKGKPATHIPVPAGAAKCDSCHKSQVLFTTSVTMNHSVVVSSACKTCHNGSYVNAGSQGALAKPAAHIPEAQLLSGANMDCKDCHNSTTSWLPARMNHNASQGNGSGWCKACHTSGTAYQGSMDKKSLTHKAKGTSPTDCSMSGCHKPLGNKGQAYSNWD